MGITSLTLSQLDYQLPKLGFPFAGMKMLELGNQYLYLDPPSGIPHLTPAKGFFAARGVRHTSIDMNGRDGALELDLAKPLPAELRVGDFDVVTNFGTAEHVDDYYACLRNMHEAVRPAGLMIHVSPASGHWPLHGKHYCTEGTFAVLSSFAGYRVAFLERHPSLGNDIDGWQIHAMLIKETDFPFPDRETFGQVPVFSK
jgi:hypothetical protein